MTLSKTSSVPPLTFLYSLWNFPRFMTMVCAAKKSNSSSGINSVGAKHSKAPTHITYLLNRSFCASNSISSFFLQLTKNECCVLFGDDGGDYDLIKRERKNYWVIYTLENVYFKWRWWELPNMIFIAIILSYDLYHPSVDPFLEGEGD